MAESSMDALEAEVRTLSDGDLRGAIEAICGDPKRDRFDLSESFALAALMAEEARRARSEP